MGLLNLFSGKQDENASTIPNTDTEKWLARTYAPWSMYFGGDWRYFAGVEEITNEQSEKLRYIMRRDWDVTDRESLLNATVLLTVLYQDSEELEKADVAVGAWDLCRACQIVSIGFICGYITRQEMLDLSIKIGKIMQRLYRSWDELYNSYLLGYKAWRYEQGDGWQQDIAEREELCQKIKRDPDGPLSLKWNLELTPPTILEKIKGCLRPTKANAIACASVIISLAIASSFFLLWNPEALLRPSTPVTQSDIRQNRTQDFTGYVAGQDIPRLNGADTFAKMIYRSSYATAQPLAIVPTGIHTLQPWVNPYSSQIFKGRTSSARKRKPQLIQSGISIVEGYSQYYLLQLPDKSYILAQLPPSDAVAIAKGEKITLPVSKRVGLTATARRALAKICAQYDVKVNGALYAFNDAWHKENFFLLFIIRFAAAALLFFALSIVLIKAGNNLFAVKN